MKEEILTAKNPRVIWSNFKGEKPGLGFEKIYIEFDYMPFQKGKVITYDLRDGQLLFINEIINNMVICQISSTHRDYWLSPKWLEKGIEYKQISNNYSIN